MSRAFTDVDRKALESEMAAMRNHQVSILKKLNLLRVIEIFIKFF